METLQDLVNLLKKNLRTIEKKKTDVRKARQKYYDRRDELNVLHHQQHELISNYLFSTAQALAIREKALHLFEEDESFLSKEMEQRDLDFICDYERCKTDISRNLMKVDYDQACKRQQMREQIPFFWSKKSTPFEVIIIEEEEGLIGLYLPVPSEQFIEQKPNETSSEHVRFDESDDLEVTLVPKEKTLSRIDKYIDLPEEEQGDGTIGKLIAPITEAIRTQAAAARAVNCRGILKFEFIGDYKLLKESLQKIRLPEEELNIRYGLKTLNPTPWTGYHNLP